MYLSVLNFILVLSILLAIFLDYGVSELFCGGIIPEYEPKCIINHPSQYFDELPEETMDYVCPGKQMKTNEAINTNSKAWCAMK